MDKNRLEIFKNEEFGEIIILREDNKELFEATGVAKVLGYSNPHDAIQRHCKVDGVVKHEVIDSIGRSQNKNFITEGNLYRLITHSKLPSAEKFENWIFDEVLPSIRKTGGYVSNDEMFINTYLPFADDTTKQMFIGTLKTVREQNKLIAEMKPKSDYFDELVERNLLTNLRDTAKELGIAPSRFNDFLLQNKYIYRDSKKKLKPYQEKVAQGLFELKEYVNQYNGHTDNQTMVTPKGRETFRLLVKELY